MNTIEAIDMTPIRETWDALEGRRITLIDTFYSRLFDRHPEYRELFPESMTPQKEKMVEMISSVARFIDQVDLIRPYLANVGAAHRGTGITARDIENFKEVFIDTLARTCSETWEPRHEKAWREVFDEVIVPVFDEGLEGNTETDESRENMAS